ncbi:hypothetical protein [Streptomyces lunalinharesii]|uniref:Uncharacterized protein n=1 Tax=Streptomyces lunalinharesii TaxID=333384 RepID=A0ABP6FAW3_9ACTN
MFVAELRGEAPADAGGPALLTERAGLAVALEDADEDQELALEDRTTKQVLDWHNHADTDHQIVHDHTTRYGEHSTQRLFTRPFVATVQRLTGPAR